MTLQIEKIFVVLFAILGFFVSFTAIFHFFLYELMDKTMLESQMYFHFILFVIGVVLFFGSLGRLIKNSFVKK